MQEKYEVQGPAEVVSSEGKVQPLKEDADQKEADVTEDSTGDSGEQM